MKILFVATDRRAAQMAAYALRGLASNVTLSWARTLPSALRWIHDNRDVSALVIEADVQRQGGASFAEGVRDLGIAAPVVVVAHEQADLLHVVTSALDRTRAAARDAAICTALQARLFELESDKDSLTAQVRRVSAACAEADQMRADAAAAAAARESELREQFDRELTIRASLQRELDEAHVTAARERTDFQNWLAARDDEIGQVGRDRDRLQRLVSDRDEELRVETARHLATQKAAQQGAADAEEKLRLAGEAGRREIGSLQQQIDTLKRELKARQTEVDSLRGELTRIPLLQMELEQGKKEARRQFERAPSPLCRCTRDGRITQANHSFARLLARKADDLRDTDLSQLFECANDFRWLLERSTNGEDAEAVETTWKTADGRRLHVRLRALAGVAGFDIAVENITGLREVEERLRQAQRMEAVGRLASEVAVTCEALLRDGEVTRVSGLLRQFAVYGDRQIDALEPVSMQKVLRNLGPVLKRVAGNDVRIALPKSTASFDVDVEAERVERILVNVASYARQRMPHGGRIKIDLATTVVDRRFLARHPDVRPGAHVLLTITEVHGAIRRVPAIDLRADVERADAPPSADSNPGVDLGALLGLIADCEGHLWMAAEPSGNMTLKIYLPSREAAASPDAAAAPARAGRARQLARWFRH